MLSQKGRTRKERIANCELARGILQPFFANETGEAKILDLLLVVQILEREAALSEDASLILTARDDFQQATEIGTTSAERISLYVEFLLRHAKSFKSGGSGSPTSASDSANLAESFLKEAQLQLDNLGRLQATGDSDMEALRTSLGAPLASSRGK